MASFLMRYETQGSDKEPEYWGKIDRVEKSDCEEWESKIREKFEKEKLCMYHIILPSKFTYSNFLLCNHVRLNIKS